MQTAGEIARNMDDTRSALVDYIGENGRTFLIGSRYEERVHKGGRFFLANNDRQTNYVPIEIR